MPSRPSPQQITGLILSGGRGTRMGSVDKGLQLLRGMPLVQHALARLQPQVGSVMINANRHLEVYEKFGVPVCTDDIDGFAGPLAGIQAGLARCNTGYMVSVPCDAPFFPPDLVSRLADALAAYGAEIAVAVTATANRRQPHPVFCLMRTALLLPHLSDYLHKGGRKAEAWYRSLRFVEVDFDDEAAFSNINTLDELHRHE